MAEDKLPQFIENDDAARAKAFWNANGKPIIVGVIIGLGAIAGFNYWKSYEQNQGENASILFDRLKSGQNDLDLKLLAKELKENYTSTAYAELAALSMAKQFVEKNDLESATHELIWVIDNSKDSGFQHIARLRLAAVMLAQENPDKALEILSITDAGSFDSRYYELTGDAYAQRSQSERKQDGDGEQAKAEYRKSLETLPSGAAHASLIQLKRDNIGNTLNEKQDEKQDE